MTQVYNFSSGPAMLPVEVLRRAEQELCNWHGLGTSVMEISHRSKEFIAVAEQSEQDLRDLLKVPANYKVLFCHGGARAQFAALPLNLLGDNTTADYIDGGYWAHSAITEAEKYCQPNVIDVKTTVDGLSGIKPMKEWQLSDNAAYVHYCPNETIDGVAIDETPDFGDKVVIGDYSSTILSRPLDVSRFGVIYAGTQKNIGPAWYLSGLVFKWLKEQGGLVEMQKRNQAKAELLYSTIDQSDFYRSRVAIANRSWMNVPFQLADPALDKVFLSEAEAIGLQALKGHRVVGGMRASIYNAMPLAGVKTLTDFMVDFERRHG